MQVLIQKVWREMERHPEQLIAIMEQLVAFQTVSPPARNTVIAQQWVKAFLEAHQFQTTDYTFYEHDLLVVGEKIGECAEQFNSLILNGHMDVAALANEQAWKTNPFQLVEQEGRLFGRGTSDMKAAMAANLWVIQLLDQLAIPLKGSLQLQSVVGEEAGEAGTRTLLEQGHVADFAIVTDTTNLALQGQGGCLTGWLTIKSPETFHDGNRRQLIHAGGGLFGASAVEKMVPIIEGLQTLERHWAVTKSYPGFPAGATTINPSYIQGGINPAFIANECHLWLTVHFYPNETVEEIQQELDAHIAAIAASDPWLKEHPPTIRWGGRSMIADQGEIFPALELDETQPGVQLLQTCHQQVTAVQPTMEMSPSVNDSGWFAYFKMPAVAYGPGELTQAHSDNESVALADVLVFAKTIAAFVIQWCNQEKITSQMPNVE